MTSAHRENSDPPGTDAPGPYAAAFEAADALAGAHGSDCVCPRCAGRLPFLLRDLARAIDDGDRQR